MRQQHKGPATRAPDGSASQASIDLGSIRLYRAAGHESVQAKSMCREVANIRWPRTYVSLATVTDVSPSVATSAAGQIRARSRRQRQWRNGCAGA